MFKINESNFFIGTQKTNQIHDGNVKKKEPFDFVTQIFGFIQPTCYASIVNKTELRKHSEKKCTHVRFIFGLTKHFDLYKRCRSRNTIFSVSNFYEVK